MLVVLGDTHGTDSPCLAGRTADAVAAADLVIHTGDFTTEAVLDGFRDRCELRAVHGNNDPPAVREQLPAEGVVEWADVRVFFAHGHEHTGTALAMAGRQANADLTVVGHSHDPGFRDAPIPVCNPGSHADPRWHRPAHAEFEWDAAAGKARGRLVDPEGEVFERFAVAPRPVGDADG
jgi:putative phosphoesterase